VLFFSDAVFAIAITLLVVDLLPGVPEVTDAGRILYERIDAMLGFLISFVVIGLFWAEHHGMFRHIKRLDTRAIGLNLALLGCIAFLPFPTALLSANSASTVAIVFYAACIAAVGLFELLLWLHASQRDAGGTDIEPALRRHLALRIAVVPFVFLLSIPVAIAWPSKAPFTWLSLIALNVVLSWVNPVRPRANDAGSGDQT
jgi:uncharacterized membrane protein